MFDLPDRIIIYDTEYTTWEGALERDWNGPGECKEVVDIGAVCVETKNFTELENFHVFVKPRRNPLLSDYFVKLTGITQQEVDENGVNFPEALNSFVGWCGESHIYSFGSDEKVIEENCRLVGISFPFSHSRCHDVRDIFMRYGVPAHDYYSSTIVRAFEEEPVRSGHTGVSDARTIVDGLRLLSKRLAKGRVG